LRRIKVASDLLKHPPATSRLTVDILNFFEVLGFYVKAGSISLRAAWELFSVFEVGYRTACRSFIQEKQRKDSTVFAALDDLAERFLKIEQKERGVKRAAAEPTEAEVRRFLEDEVNLLFVLSVPEPPPPPGGIPTEPLPEPSA
jgi:hypothetical protein